MSTQCHPVFARLVASLAVLPGLRNHVAVVVVHGDADEALLPGDVPPLRVRVDEAGVGLGPLPEAAVLALLVDLAGVPAVVHRVEHDLGVVAVGVRPRAEALGVGQYTGVLSDQRTVWRVFEVRPS